MRYYQSKENSNMETINRFNTGDTVRHTMTKDVYTVLRPNTGPSSIVDVVSHPTGEQTSISEFKLEFVNEIIVKRDGNTYCGKLANKCMHGLTDYRGVVR